MYTRCSISPCGKFYYLLSIHREPWFRNPCRSTGQYTKVCRCPLEKKCLTRNIRDVQKHYPYIFSYFFGKTEFFLPKNMSEHNTRRFQRIDLESIWNRFLINMRMARWLKKSIWNRFFWKYITLQLIPLWFHTELLAENERINWHTIDSFGSMRMNRWT